jgi:hypothetical protein
VVCCEEDGRLVRLHRWEIFEVEELAA